MATQEMYSALSIENSTELDIILQELKECMEQEEIDNLCSGVNFEEEVKEGEGKQEKEEKVVLEEKEEGKESQRSPLTHIAEDISDDEGDQVTFNLEVDLSSPKTLNTLVNMEVDQTPEECEIIMGIPAAEEVVMTTLTPAAEEDEVMSTPVAEEAMSEDMPTLTPAAEEQLMHTLTPIAEEVITPTAEVMSTLTPVAEEVMSEVIPTLTPAAEERETINYFHIPELDELSLSVSYQILF